MSTATPTPDQAAAARCEGYYNERWSRPTDMPCQNPAHATADGRLLCYICMRAYISDHPGAVITCMPSYRDNIGPVPTPDQAEMTNCPVCKRRYAASGRSIHYCHPSHEYIAHFDNQQIGVGYPTHTAAETALDDHCWWLAEQPPLTDVCSSCGDQLNWSGPGLCGACLEAGERWPEIRPTLLDAELREQNLRTARELGKGFRNFVV